MWFERLSPHVVNNLSRIDLEQNIVTKYFFDVSQFASFAFHPLKGRELMLLEARTMMEPGVCKEQTLCIVYRNMVGI